MEMKVEVKSKKESVITLRLDADTTRIIKQLAKKDERTTSWMARKLIIEALLIRQSKERD